MQPAAWLKPICLAALGSWSLSATGAEFAPRRTSTDLPAGMGVLVPGRWGTVGVQVANPGDAAVEVLSSHFFPGAADVQFGRRLWVPARARRLASYPVRVPEGS